MTPRVRLHACLLLTRVARCAEGRPHLRHLHTSPLGSQIGLCSGLSCGETRFLLLVPNILLLVRSCSAQSLGKSAVPILPIHLAHMSTAALAVAYLPKAHVVALPVGSRYFCADVCGGGVCLDLAEAFGSVAFGAMDPPQFAPEVGVRAGGVGTPCPPPPALDDGLAVYEISRYGI